MTPLVERVIGRCDPARPIEFVEIAWRDTVRRALRLTSESGRRVNVLLERNHATLHDGDVLAIIDDRQLVVRVRESDLLRLAPTTLRQMAELAAELGNQHVPIEFDGDAILTLDDGPVRALADRLGVSFVATRAAFHPTRSSCLAIEVARRPT